MLHQPLFRGLTQLLDHVGEPLDLAMGFGDVAAFRQRDVRQEQGVGEPFLVGEGFPDPPRLGGDRLPLGRVLRPERRPEAPHERIDEAGPIVETPCELDGLPTERVAVAPTLRRATPCAGQPRQQSGAEAFVASAQHDQGVLEHRDQSCLLARARPLLSTADPKGGSCQMRPGACPSCDRGGVEERPSRGSKVTRP